MQRLKENFKTENETAKESWFISMAEFMKALGKMTKGMEEDTSTSKMATHIKANMRMEKRTVKEFFLGPMENLTTVNG